MPRKFFLKAFVMIFITTVAFLQSKQVKAQFNNNPTPLGSRFGQTDANGNQLGWIRSVGIGNFTNNNAQTNSFFHINSNYLLLPQNGSIAGMGEVFRTDAPNNSATYWRMLRGGTEIGRFFNNPTFTANNDFNIMASQYNADIVFRTNRANNIGVNLEYERMRVGQGTINLPALNNYEVTRITISEDPATPITVPASLLHIGFNAPVNGFGGGWRNWMDVGTYTSTGTDNLYVGMKESNGTPQGWSDNQNAVISWGNNPQTGAGHSDKLRFIFTSATGTSLVSAGQEGLEIARMVTDGNTGRMGIGNFFTPNVNPINTLEIRSDIAASNLNPTNATAPTRSGLRFTNLNATLGVDALTNSSNTVLSVNNTGDVILVEGTRGIGTCAAPTLLSSDAAIQLNGNRFYFDGQGINDKVGIGIPCANTITAKFQVENVLVANQPLSRVAGLFQNTGNDPSSAAFTFGVVGNSIASGSIANVGGFFRGAAPTSSSISFGVNAIATGAFRNVAVIGTVANQTGSNPNDVAGLFNGNLNYTGLLNGVSDASLKENVVGFNGALNLLSKVEPKKFDFKTVPYLALADGTQYGMIAQDVELVIPELVSDINLPEMYDPFGNLVGTAQTYKGINYLGFVPITVQAIKELDKKLNEKTLSDAQLKQNVQPLQNSLFVISQLNGVSFEWNQQVDSTLQLPSGTEIGLIAQDVNNIIPEVIYTDDQNYKHVEYSKIVPYLIEANKDLKDSLDDLKNQIALLSQQVAAIQNCMDNLPIGAGCSGNSLRQVDGNIAQQGDNQKIKLESIEPNIILYQNEPNPFNNNTIIRYFLPENAVDAKLVFHDEYGREIGSELLNTKGYSQISVDGERLASGIYTYSIVINGQVVTSKRMVKNK